jgi:hypothetical protein
LQHPGMAEPDILDAALAQPPEDHLPGFKRAFCDQTERVIIFE